MSLGAAALRRGAERGPAALVAAADAGAALLRGGRLAGAPRYLSTMAFVSGSSAKNDEQINFDELFDDHRTMLNTEPSVATLRFDTAENELSEVKSLMMVGDLDELLVN